MAMSMSELGYHGIGTSRVQATPSQRIKAVGRLPLDSHYDVNENQHRRCTCACFAPAPALLLLLLRLRHLLWRLLLGRYQHKSRPARLHIGQAKPALAGHNDDTHWAKTTPFRGSDSKTTCRLEPPQIASTVWHTHGSF